MVITRHGAGSYRIQTGGLSVVVDPEDNRLKADITLYTKMPLPLSDDFRGPGVIIGPGEYDVKGVTIKGFPAAEKGNGEKNLETVYNVRLEGMSLVFLGAPQSALDIALAEKVQTADILFAPPGTAKLAHQFEPKIIAPTHIASKEKIDKDFASKVEAGEKLTIKQKDLPQATEVFYING